MILFISDKGSTWGEQSLNDGLDPFDPKVMRRVHVSVQTIQQFGGGEVEFDPDGGKSYYAHCVMSILTEEMEEELRSGRPIVYPAPVE